MKQFEVHDCAPLMRMSGLPPAMNLRERRDRIATCDENVMYHHFCETTLRPMFDNPDDRNDFAVWPKLHLGDRVLAERLGILDPNSFAEMEELRTVVLDIIDEFGLEPDRPLLVQISRFDRFKDPIGVIRASRPVRAVAPVQLVLVGGGATDDPEGKAILGDVVESAEGDPDIHVLLFPSGARKTINALQRLTDIALQKSTREGFGLTATEGLWKGKPVVGGDVGGIRLQITNYLTGFLVNTPEGAGHRIRYLVHPRERMKEMGEAGREFVRENFLLTRNLRDYLALLFTIRSGRGEHVVSL